MGTSGFSIDSGASMRVWPRGDYDSFGVEEEVGIVVVPFGGDLDDACVIEGSRERVAAELRKALASVEAMGEEAPEPKRYVLQSLDASDLRTWDALAEFDRVGDALTARDKALADEPEWLPSNRHRVVDMENGTVVEWGKDSV